jgi:hypothetical protein
MTWFFDPYEFCIVLYLPPEWRLPHLLAVEILSVRDARKLH